MAELDLQPVLDLEPVEDTKLDLQPVETVEAPSWIDPRKAEADKVVQEILAQRAANPPSQVPTTIDKTVDWLQRVEEAKQAAVESGVKTALARGRVDTGFAPSPKAEDFIAQNVAGLMSSESLAVLPLFGMGAAPRLAMGIAAASQVPENLIQGTPEGVAQGAINAVMAAAMLHGGPVKEAEVAPETPKAEVKPPPVPEQYPKAEPVEPVEPVEPAEPVVEPPATADVTRILVDARKNLLSEAGDLQSQANISMAATGTVHPAIEQRLAAINEELNHPTIGVPITPDTPVEEVIKHTTVAPDEVAQGVAESTTSTAPGEIPAGQQQVESQPEISLGIGSEGAAVRERGGASVTAGLARSTIEDQIDRGILPEDALVLGEGWNAQEAAQRGNSLVNAGINPGIVLDAIQGKRAIPIDPSTGKRIDLGDAVAVLESESRRLAGERATAQERFGIGSPQALVAQATENHFLQTARPTAGGLVQRAMKAFEDQTPVDLSDYHQLYTKAAKLVEGREIPVGQQIELARKAQKAKGAIESVGEAIGKREEVLRKELPRVKHTDENMKAMIDDLVKELTPCK